MLTFMSYQEKALRSTRTASQLIEGWLEYALSSRYNTFGGGYRDQNQSWPSQPDKIRVIREISKG